ncbi:MAG TPA: FHA domain-containing protein, partial [Polyangiaceae bacterium]|nr:FHA domain-containing protein [Polyangiaceae bacterium]
MSSNDDPSGGKPTIPPGPSEATELEATGFDEAPDDDMSPDQVYLIVQSGDLRRLVDVADGDDLVAGRDDGCDLTIDEPKISRRHFAVRRNGSILTLEDLDSTNGTKLNGVTLRGAQRRVVSGDVISIGRTLITVAASAGSGVAATVTSRLDLELSRLRESGQRAA